MKDTFIPSIRKKKALKNFGKIYLADTFVVKETHWLTNVSGVEPVMSSHWAGVVPPETDQNP